MGNFFPITQLFHCQPNRRLAE